MPTATAANNWSLTNLGPLTTTFTPAPSCSTKYDQLLIGQNTTDGDTHSASLVPVGNLCSSDASAADCRPSGSALDSLYSSYLADPGPLSGEVAYYSPGLMCPSGYATVGLATKLADGSATSSGDAFPQAGDDDDDDDSASFDLLNPGLNALVEAMGPGETAIVCCPSGFTADVEGLCSSTIPAGFPIPSSVCVLQVNPDDIGVVSTTITTDGRTLTEQVISLTLTGPSPYITETVTLNASTLADPAASGYVAVTIQKVMYLVHAATDTAAASGSSASASSATGTPQRAGLAAAGMLFTLFVAFTSGFVLIIT